PTRRRAVLGGLACLVLLLLGCGPGGGPLPGGPGGIDPPTPPPRLEGVTKVELRLTHHPTRGALKPVCTVVLTRKEAIAEVVGWLRGVDWSQAGEDTAPIRLPEPAGYLHIHRQDGTEDSFAFYWDGKFVHGNRLRRVDVAGLSKIVQKLCP